MSYVRTCLALLATPSLVESLTCNAGTKTEYSTECGWTDTDTFSSAPCLFGETTCVSFSHWWTSASGCVTSKTQGACSGGLSDCTVQNALYQDNAVYKDYSCDDTCSTNDCNGMTVTAPNSVTPFTCNTGTKTDYSTECGWTDTDTFSSTPCILGEESCISISYYTESGTGGCTTSITSGLCTNALTNCAVQDAIYDDATGYNSYSCAECTSIDCNTMDTVGPNDMDGSPKQAAAGMAILGAVIAQMLLGF